MKFNKKIIVSAVVVAFGLVTLSGCTALEDKAKGFESDSVGLHRVITVYSMDGKAIKQYEGKKVRTYTDDGGRLVINLDGKRIQVLNADVVIEEK